MKRFEYFEPRTLAEASALLARYGGRAQPLAGGTDLLVELRGAAAPRRLRGQHQEDSGHRRALSFDPQAGLRIGALVTARALEVSEVIREKYPSLLQAVRELGSIQVRNRATIVGNVLRLALGRHAAAADRRRRDGFDPRRAGQAQPPAGRLLHRAGQDRAEARRADDRNRRSRACGRAAARSTSSTAGARRWSLPPSVSPSL